MDAASLRTLTASRVVVLDGATGTELTRRGVPTTLPLWSAAALLTHPQVVEAIHRDYVEAGAEIIVANTFRTNVRTLRAAGLLGRGAELNGLAIELARRAVAAGVPAGSEAREGIPAKVGARTNSRTSDGIQNPESKIALVAASAAPVEDCYHPERVPDYETLLAEHWQMMTWLRNVAADPRVGRGRPNDVEPETSGPRANEPLPATHGRHGGRPLHFPTDDALRPLDLVWIETMNTVREARAAATAARAAGFEFAVSFVTREGGDLLSGEPLEDAVAAIDPLAPLAIGLNCIPPAGMTANLPRLVACVKSRWHRRTVEKPAIAAYAHIGNPEPICGWSFSQTTPPKEYAEHAKCWVEMGARIIGGCCGTTPEHVAGLARRLQ